MPSGFPAGLLHTPPGCTVWGQLVCPRAGRQGSPECLVLARWSATPFPVSWRAFCCCLLVVVCPPPWHVSLLLPLPPPINRGRRCKDFTSHPSRLAGGAAARVSPLPPSPLLPVHAGGPYLGHSVCQPEGVGGARCVTFLCCFRGCLPRGCTVSRRSAAQVQRLRRQGLRLLPLRCHLGGEAPMQAPRGWGEVGGLLAELHLRCPGYGRRRPKGWG